MKRQPNNNKLWYVAAEDTVGNSGRHHGLVLRYVNNERQKGMAFEQAEKYAQKIKAEFPDTRYFLLKSMFEVVPTTGFTLAETDPRPGTKTLLGQ